jgi:cobyrinic acid a,c-diamide synthase
VTRTPALLISAPASGQGKTSVTAALARFHKQRGRRVRVFKTGPDFLDPMLLAHASGAPVYNLDLWMTGAADCQRRLARVSAECDLLLVEGVMGLYDGEPSSADLAQRFGLPVLAVIDASAMAQTFGAVAQGLAAYRPSLHVAAVVANRIGGEAHARMLRDSLPDSMPMWAALPHETAFALPERHLGLIQPGELTDLEARLDRGADLWAAHGRATLPEAVDFDPPKNEDLPRLLAGRRIAIARDAAFSFLYAANLDTLRGLGAELRFFSPLQDTDLPPCDAVWLPGGYPELHLHRLAGNVSVRKALRAHHAAGKPILAECGGMLWLLDTLTDAQGHEASMLGLLPGRARMQTRLAALGLQSIELPEGTLRGHSFHYSALETALTPLARGRCPNGGNTAEAVYRVGRTTASYVHCYFPSNPAATAALLTP